MTLPPPRPERALAPPAPGPLPARPVAQGYHEAFAPAAPPRTKAPVPAAPRSSSPPDPNAGSSWQAHPWQAHLLQLVILVAPGVFALVTSLVLGRTLPRASSTPLALVRVAVIVALSAATIMGVRAMLHRLAPLTVLLRLSMAFPNEAPRRLRTALRAPSVRRLEQRLEELDAEGAGGEPIDVATEIVTMIGALSAHHRLTRGHSERVRAYAELIGAEMGLDDDALQKLRWAALLHDMGKVTVPTEILDLKGRPDADQWDVLTRHPAASARITESLRGWLGEWWYGIGEHHERWDGKGYPNGLAGESITVAGRIVALADAFETMTAIRSYKRPMSFAAAQAEAVHSAGSHFDPAVVRALLNVSLGRLRRAAGLAAWLPLQLVDAARLLSNLATSAAQMPAAIAVAGAVTATAIVPAVRNEVWTTPKPTADSTVIGLEVDRTTTTTTIVHTTPRPASPVATTAPAVAPIGAPLIDSTAVPAPTSAPAPETTTTGWTAATATPTSAPSTVPTTAGSGTTSAPTTILRPTTTVAPPSPTETATTAETLPPATTTTSAAPETATTTNTGVPANAPTFTRSPALKFVGDGRTASLRDIKVDGHGLPTTCTISVSTTSATTTGDCADGLSVTAPMWNTSYQFRVVANSSAGASAVWGITTSTGPKTLRIDASSHWPCPGIFCGADTRAYASPALLAPSRSRSADATVNLLCTTLGDNVRTQAPASSGNEQSSVWVKSNESTRPYYSVLSFPTLGETAADGLPAC